MNKLNIPFLSYGILALILSLFTGVASPPVYAADELPDLGQAAGFSMPPAEERALGESVMAQVRQELMLVDDPELEQYLHNLGYRLLDQVKDKQHRYQFFYVINPQLNAFAIPGGFIGIHTGLVLTADNEAELASVIGHEIAHVELRHWARIVDSSNQRMKTTLAALLAAMVVASTGNGNAVGAVAMGSIANNSDQTLVYTRRFEREADRIGIRILSRSNFNSSAMATFFEKVGMHSSMSGGEGPEFTRSHPVTVNRIAEARAYAAKSGGKLRDSSAFRHAKARLRALYTPPDKNILTYFKKQLESTGADQNAMRYGYALALSRFQQHKAALAEINVLIKARPRERRYQLARADILLNQGRRAQALMQYERIVRTSKKIDPWLALRYARVLIENGKSKRAVTILRPVLRLYPGSPVLQKLMARAAGNAGDRVRAHRAQAEYFVLNGNPEAAVDQLYIALRHTNKDHYATAAIKARIKELQKTPKS